MSDEENELGIHWLVLILVAGVAIAAWGGWAIYDERQTIDSAVEVEAVVLDSHVNEVKSEDEYYPQITYEYTYEGQRYTSDNVYASPDSTSIEEASARSLVEDYPEGETVTDHVDSENPSEAYLETMHKDTLGMGLAILLGIAMVALSLNLLVKRIVGISPIGKLVRNRGSS